MVNLTASSLKTVLHDRHVALGAKMAVFAGWQMPISYSGIIEEHKNVRQCAGLFDVSHMGQIEIVGEEAEQLLDYLSTNHITNKQDGTAIYTVWCDSQGKAIDDLIVYKINSNRWMVVANAGNREKDLQHLIEQAKPFKVHIQAHYQDRGILALQGPKAELVLTQLFPECSSLRPMRLKEMDFRDKPVIISKTGYTGAGGFELFAENAVIAELWDEILKLGQSEGVIPVGLGARDTLRLEKGFALYGHELSSSIAPTESVSAWTVKSDKEFLGKKILEELESSSQKRFQYGVVLKAAGIAREGYVVSQNSNLVGIVTSGTYSPILQKAIAIVMVNVPLSLAQLVQIKIRSQDITAEVVPLPFL